ncbi:MAG: site-specific DNA-methyltransferase [Clostridia bacterium]|nr:site-specific DNA-methyltransferase [Clostridia bacterium]
MKKLNLETKNLAKDKFIKLAELFPNAITETIVGQDEDGNNIIDRAIDADVLRQEIAEHVIEGREERYEFTWPDKRKSMLLANAPINKTLRPIREDSLNFDETENLYIEGDNLDVLKLLRETYLGKVKMIYIDPPYNTGNDFVYEDDFAQNMEDYKEVSGDFDEEGNRLFKNTDSNGRFHTDWLNMMYPRLKLARDLLSDDGVIFISIDDNEVKNLRNICDEIFGENNFIASVIWERAFSPVNLKKHFSENHDYIVCYAKKINSLICNGLPRGKEANDRYSNPDNDLRGNWASSDLSVGPAIQSNIYEITTPSGRKVLPPSGYSWRLSKKRYLEFLADNRIWFGEEGNGVPRIKRFLSEVKQGITPMTIWKYQDVGHSQKASQDLKKLFDNNAYFTYPKPIELITRVLTLYTDKDSVILDFFSGSATTAHAVMDLNAEDGGNRKYIMVQLPEETEEKSEAYKAGYKNICEIGKERIRRAGKKIKEDYPDSKFDDGFRVLRVDSSNMKDVYHKPEGYSQSFLDKMESNIKEDRNEEDLLFQVMLSLGIDLSSKIEKEEINDNKVLIVEDGFLISCFDEEIFEETVESIAKKQPYYAVFSEGKMSDSTLANFEQIFDTYSKTTIRKIL